MSNKTQQEKKGQKVVVISNAVKNPDEQNKKANLQEIEENISICKKTEKLKVPLRMCIACRCMKEKQELIRIVKNKDSKISIDPTFKASGRGAYVCKTKECFEKLVKSKAINRSFKCQVNPEILENLKECIK